MDSNQNGKTHLLPYLYIFYTFFNLKKQLKLMFIKPRDSTVLSLTFDSQAINSVNFAELELILFVTCLLMGVTFLGFSVGAAGTEFPPPPGCIPSPIDWSFSSSPPTAICLGYMQLEHGNNKTNKSKISGVPCMYVQTRYMAWRVCEASKFPLAQIPTVRSSCTSSS